jgi:hypothetical protein
MYPTAIGSDVGTVATGQPPSMPGGQVAPITGDPLMGVSSQGIIMGGIVFVALVFGLMFLAKRLGTDDDFKALRPRVYNVATIGLAAAAGLPLIKLAVVKVASLFPPLKPVAAWVAAA